jgi:hypothetical protein
MNIFWEYFHNARTNRAQASADNAQANVYDTERRIKQLEAEVDSLTLITMAMWELFGTSNGLFMKDLEAKMQEIDLRDGKLDGKLSLEPNICTGCNRKLDQRRKICVYCGAVLKKGTSEVKEIL